MMGPFSAGYHEKSHRKQEALIEPTIELLELLVWTETLDRLQQIGYY